MQSTGKGIFLMYLQFALVLESEKNVLISLLSLIPVACTVDADNTIPEGTEGCVFIWSWQVAHHFQIYEGEKLHKNRKISIICHIYKNKMLLLNALKTKRKKRLCKEIFQAAFASACTSFFLMDFCRT